MVFALKAGVVKLAPVNNKLPPVAASYQVKGAVPLAAMVVEVPVQIMVVPVSTGVWAEACPASIKIAAAVKRNRVNCL